MSDEILLARLSQPEAESRLKNSRLAVMALGSVEQHGPHLPLGTDAFAADALAEAVARRLNAVLVPMPLVGVSPYHLSWAGCQSKFNRRGVIAEAHLITHQLFGERAQLTHAGNMETAAVLMYDPSLVDLTRATNPTPQEEGDAGDPCFLSPR